MKANNVKEQDKKTAGKSRSMKRLRLVLIFAAVVFVIGIGAFVFLNQASGASGVSNRKVETFTVSRGDLTISVTESGDIKAVKSKDIKSEVEGRTTIISIVDEGTVITPEDVNNGKILVELDSSDIKEKLTQQEITFLNAEASHTEAKEALDIQKKQNESDIQAGEMKVRFSLMDLYKYLGEEVAGELVSGAATPTADPNEIASLIKSPELSGEAQQKRQELNDNITLADSKLERAKGFLAGTQKLYDANYVAKTELEADKLAVQSLDIQKKGSEIALELFELYEFPKEAEKRLSDYYEAKRELERIEARARSKLAQAEAKLGSKDATYSLQKERLEKLQKQFDACIIRAPAPGEVVYSSSTDRWRRRNRPIEIGGEVRQRQKIISIPDTSAMKVEIKIHETWVDKVQIGQKARITIAAFRDETFTGEVLKKAPMADPEEWMNPDLKVYTTDVSIDGTHEFLKTGMTGKVEVIIDELKDILSVPIQSVVNREGKKVCYVATDKGTEQREVETGLFNEDFVEIKSGLTKDEKVLLNPPRLIESENE